ncbi:guanylate kinase [Candidatus Berkiella cookevillensis]|uniref:Guanylate kinase n=1 Tax=Candidatus Berkiella cookevillensis TaxID=437022 RepID=A0A0Q9YFZ1_9GAMM|nr:guanylate kinase [Candidatus Berkiella cookevillensis]MCS5707452.1 guanylate kinase [Candidatus Berkiella cookevillensis]
MKLGELYIISAPSGAGKTTLVNALLASLDNIQISVSYTTRPPRAKEVNHRDYVFLDEETFEQYQQQNRFLESAKVFKYSYGTSKDWVEEKLKAGIDVVLEIDWQGARIVKSITDCVSIFLLPPSKQDLKKRLELRNQDKKEVIEYRMEQANEEISHYAEYDYVVVNDDFEKAAQELIAIIRARRLVTARQKVQYQELISELLA